MALSSKEALRDICTANEGRLTVIQHDPSDDNWPTQVGRSGSMEEVKTILNELPSVQWSVLTVYNDKAKRVEVPLH